LAGESRRYEIDFGREFFKVSDVGLEWNPREAATENFQRRRVLLAEKGRAEACFPESEFESPDSCKQSHDTEWLRH
jgi:hypothetical protein